MPATTPTQLLGSRAFLILVAACLLTSACAGLTESSPEHATEPLERRNPLISHLELSTAERTDVERFGSRKLVSLGYDDKPILIQTLTPHPGIEPETVVEEIMSVARGQGWTMSEQRQSGWCGYRQSAYAFDRLRLYLERDPDTQQVLSVTVYLDSIRNQPCLPLAAEPTDDAEPAEVHRADLELTAFATSVAEDTAEIDVFIRSLDTTSVKAPSVVIEMSDGVSLAPGQDACKVEDELLRCKLAYTINSSQLPTLPVELSLALDIAANALDPSITLQAESQFNPVSNDPYPTNNIVILDLTN